MYNIILRDRDNNILAKLDKIGNISFSKRFNQANEINFTIPKDDPKVKYIQQAYYIEVYREENKKIAGIITKRNFDKNPIQITALSYEILLSNLICPYSWIYENKDVADIIRDLVLKSEIFVKQTKEDWEDTNGSLYQVDTTTQPTRYGDVVLAKDNTGAYYSNGYIITAPIDLGSSIYKVDKIRYSATTGERVRITIQARVGNTTSELNTDSWSSEYSSLTDEDAEKKGIDFSLFNKPTKRYIQLKINLYTDDTETPDPTGTTFGFTPILHAIEVIGRYQTELDTSLLPISLGITAEKEEFSYQNHLDIFNSICQKYGLTGYVDTEKRIIVKKETDVDYLGEDLSDTVILRHGENSMITQLNDDDNELVNCLTCLGSGEGGKQLRVILKDQESINLYGERWGTYENSNITSLSELISKGQEYLNKKKNPEQKFEIQVFKYHENWGEINLGDKVRVISQIHNINTTGRILEERREYIRGQETITLGINNVLGSLIDNLTGREVESAKKISTPPPFNVKLIQGHGFIELRWSGSVDYYVILHSTNGVYYSVLENSYTGNTYRHTNLEIGSQHWYKVIAVKNGITSSVAGPIMGYAKDTTPPPVPTNITITPIINGFTITIEPPTVPDWDGFEIHVSTSSGFTPTSTTLKAKGKASTFNIQDLIGGTPYYVKVISYDTSGNKSAPSSQYTVIPKKITDSDVDTAPPDVPTGLSLQTYLDGVDAQKYGKYIAVIKATWDQVSASDLEGYQVRIRKGTETDYTVVSTKDTYYLFRNLMTGTQYKVSVRAYDKFGNYSNWSSEATITTAGDSIPPSIPTGITATAYFKTIVVRWIEVPEPDLAGYELYASTTPNFTPSSSNLIYVGKSNSYSFSADVNQTWYFKVRSYDTSGNFSNFSTEVSATTAQIQTADIAVNSIASNLIQAGAITTDHLSANCITTDHLSANCITGEKISTNAIETKHIQADAITFQQLSLDTQLIAWGTSFEDDTDGDGIPDGWVIPSGQPTSYVKITTEGAWQGKYSLKMFRPGNYNSVVWIICNKLIPLTGEDRPLLVGVVAKRTSGDSMLYFTLREYDINRNYITSSSRAFSGLTSSWLDFVFQVNLGSLELDPRCRYIQIALDLSGGTQDTTVYVDTIWAKPAAFVPTSYGSLFTISGNTYQIIDQTYYEDEGSKTRIYTFDLVDKFIKITRVYIKIPSPTPNNPATCFLGLSKIGGRGFYTDTYTIGTIPAYSNTLDITLSPPRTSFRNITITLTAPVRLYLGDYTIQIYGNIWGLVF